MQSFLPTLKPTSKINMTIEQYIEKISTRLESGISLSTFPLYFYSDKENDSIFTEKGKRQNLNPEIINRIAKKLGLEFVLEKNQTLFNKPLHNKEASPPLEGCLKGGVVISEEHLKSEKQNNKKQKPQISINNTPIKRNFVKDLPYNPKLKQLAREKRKAGILSEVLFWQQVHKGIFHKIDFDRQRVIGSFIVDFYVKTLGLIIEIDGSSHDDKVEYDKLRQDYLESFGLRVYRITDYDVKSNLGRVMLDLEKYIVDEYGDCHIHPAHPAALQHPSKGGEFVPSKGFQLKEGETGEFDSIDILDYIYAVLHSPTYREKYMEFLKIDFPRVPYPKDKDTFWELVKLGREIRQIYLFDKPAIEKNKDTQPCISTETDRLMKEIDKIEIE